MPTSLCWCPQDATYQKFVLSAATAQDHPICVGAKVVTVGLQDPVMHKDTEALFSKLPY